MIICYKKLWKLLIDKGLIEAAINGVDFSAEI